MLGAMPELPEVETMCRGIADCVGRRVQSVRRPPCRLRPIAMAPTFSRLRRRLVGQVIDSVDRLGKRVIVGLQGGDALVFAGVRLVPAVGISETRFHGGRRMDDGRRDRDQRPSG